MGVRGKAVRSAGIPRLDHTHTTPTSTQTHTHTRTQTLSHALRAAGQEGGHTCILALLPHPGKLLRGDLLEVADPAT
jgi:hypothetical protein